MVYQMSDMPFGRLNGIAMAAGIKSCLESCMNTWFMVIRKTNIYLKLFATPVFP